MRNHLCLFLKYKKLELSLKITAMKIIIKLLCLLLLLPSYASAIEVTFLNPGKSGERFWDMVSETMRAAAADFNIDLEIVYAERNRVKMVELGRQISARTNPPDYLILVNEEQAAEKVFHATRGSKTKTLMLLNDFLPSQRPEVGFPGSDNPNLLGAIVPDNAAAGHRMMNALLKCAEGRGDPSPYHVLAIGGDKLTPASIDRNNGALSVVNAHKDKLVLDRFLYANWNQQEASKITKTYLQWATRNGIKPSAIWAANDPIAAGAKEGLSASGLQPGKDVCLVGLNWSSQGLDMVDSGEMLLTDGGHFLAGAWSIVLLNDYHTRATSGNTAPPGRVNFQMQSIDRSNIKQYRQYLGDENWTKIDFSGFQLKSKEDYSRYNFSLENVFNNIRQ